jgi:hypothetical protein
MGKRGGKRTTCAHASSTARRHWIDLGFFAEAKLALRLRRAIANEERPRLNF